ncbi:hypothetical protein PF010_g5597 [Phytophthora fragariae]|uniref:Secreted protein n=1 Tax=Phytophthora fragariae TaxID=53985 RepID=A0A6G0PG16_9STRA|nr:hypothetical protein PF010_g5597 [Phytophthora fragariae]KAE9245170.1 hypothetical protein PF004_g5367 [Phytophthora fragariae]
MRLLKKKTPGTVCAFLSFLPGLAQQVEARCSHLPPTLHEAYSMLLGRLKFRGSIHQRPPTLPTSTVSRNHTRAIHLSIVAKVTTTSHCRGHFT